ncbi:MAG: cell division protein FtsZ [Piscirickettsiaceae bacterium]|nr:cell division protein FtsZ [Piscirickettsiaceae bacterium]
MTFELIDTYTQNAVIKVVGVGGGGGNALKHMVSNKIEGVDFICANTDAQALRKSSATIQLQLGTDITKGLGAGAEPDVGRQAALEDRERIMEVISGADMVFITAGMGGGTGTGAAPVVAQISKEMGILTVAIVTKPFLFEGAKRLKIANKGVEELSQHVDSLITIPNEKLLVVLGKEMSLLDAFKAANDVLLGAVQGIAELITREGMINVDFADVRTVMSEMGMAMMGTGYASGEGRATKAAMTAVSSPLLEDVDLSGARGVLVNITAGFDMTIGEFEEIGNMVKKFASEDATVVVGTVIDSEMTDELRVTVVATGLGGDKLAQVDMPPESALPQIEIVQKSIDIDHYKPTVARQGRPQAQNQSTGEINMDYLDIPAFLRK